LLMVDHGLTMQPYALEAFFFCGRLDNFLITRIAGDFYKNCGRIVVKM
jgi:hypothetical protein